MICAIVYQLTANADIEDIENTPFAPYYINHTKGLYPSNAAGIPWSANGIQSKGDPITDMHEDMAAEQKARTTYDNLMRLARGTSAYEPLKCLRAREIVHYQRFGEALRIVQDNLDARNFYAFNPEFDVPGITKRPANNRPASGYRNNAGENRNRKSMENRSGGSSNMSSCPCSKTSTEENRSSVQDVLGK